MTGTMTWSSSIERMQEAETQPAPQEDVQQHLCHEVQHRDSVADRDAVRSSDPVEKRTSFLPTLLLGSARVAPLSSHSGTCWDDSDAAFCGQLADSAAAASSKPSPGDDAQLTSPRSLPCRSSSLLPGFLSDLRNSHASNSLTEASSKASIAQTVQQLLQLRNSQMVQAKTDNGVNSKSDSFPTVCDCHLILL